MTVLDRYGKDARAFIYDANNMPLDLRCAYCLEPVNAVGAVVLDPEFDETDVPVHPECKVDWDNDRIAEAVSDRANAWRL